MSNRNQTYTKPNYQTVPTETVNVNEIDFHYRRLGQDKPGLPVIYLNHLAATMDNCDPDVMNGLAAEHQIICFDNRGIGSSKGDVPLTIAEMAEDARAFIHALGFDKVDLIGFSLGGFIAQEILLQEPELVRSVVLAGTGPAGGSGIEDVTKITYLDMLRGFFSFNDPKAFLFFNRNETGKKAAEEFLERLGERTEDNDEKIKISGFQRQLKAIHAWALQKPQDLSVITHPALIVNGDNDRMVPSSNTYDLHNRIAGSELIIYKDSGHGGIFQYHDEFVGSVLAFLSNQNPTSNEQKRMDETKVTKQTTETLYADIDGLQIAYRKFGSGDPIIFANRFRGTLDTWDPLFLELLAEKNTVVQFDYPGIGYSEGELPLDAKEVASYVDKVAQVLSLEKYAVLGWSYGGVIAQYAAFLQPEKVTASIVIGSNPIGKNEAPIKQLFLDKAFIPDYTLEDEIVLFYEPKSEKSRQAAKISHDRIEKVLDRSKVPTDPAIFQRFFAISEQVAVDVDGFRAAYKTTKIPFLAISADNDISFAVENWFPLLQNAPTLQHIILNGTGHAPHFQYPELSVGYIRSFLKA